MRRTADRIRHAVSFEVIGLMTVIPLGAWVFDKPMQDIGVVGVAGATLAMAWNYVYNLLFDHAMLRLRGHVAKTPGLRILHAVLFELGLLILLLPVFALYLGIGLVQALVMDLGFAAFFVVYAFVFNWAYDLVFPIPEPGQSGIRAQ
ncbi:Uncharacterized membrane protein [Cribrihabitans marinus]|uniref:Uncharacterized membrane protein n=1 Tax=Cribrihabitans marinus TaxID=1227549 RepID=A0A1H7DGR4_9RHOB|nr:PACE efflux transporter [Cribrihabitans marinus]GGH38711.1 membrane protein [Cribrihabitans marinus]SEK00087.1 Uncharacterized membrane protein [Cribrihabitans marinus]